MGDELFNDGSKPILNLGANRFFYEAVKFNQIGK